MNRGFSLVELSIVLVILGLLVGGVLTGQSLIRAAELRSVATEFQKYQAAVHSFRDKYFALPGDMTNATSFWGYPAATPANCPMTAGTGTQTCNGNGDGVIEVGGVSRYQEAFMFWQHLANAGLIEGTYTGRATAVGMWDASPGINVPRSKLGGAAWSVVLGTTGIFVDLFTPPTRTFMLFGEPGLNEFTWDPILKAEEAWNIDSKMDDGKPGMGAMQTFNNSRHPSCTDSDVAASAVYQVDNAVARACSLILREF